MRSSNRLLKIGAVLIGLLAIIALTNSLTAPPADKTDDNSEQADAPAEPASEASEKGMAELPEPLGSPDAPVTINVYMTSGNACDTTTIDNMIKLHEELGENVYIKFLDMKNEKIKKEAQKHKIGCKTGLTINGRTKFLLPELGLEGAMLFDGPVGMKNYQYEDILTVVEHLLKKKGELPEDTGGQKQQADAPEKLPPSQSETS